MSGSGEYWCGHCCTMFANRANYDTHRCEGRQQQSLANEAGASVDRAALSERSTLMFGCSSCGNLFLDMQHYRWHSCAKHKGEKPVFPGPSSEPWRPRAGEVCRTRDGRRARVVCVDRGDPSMPVVALYAAKDAGGREGIGFYSAEGKCFNWVAGNLSQSGGESPLDLLPGAAPRRAVVWVRGHFYESGKVLSHTDKKPLTAAEAKRLGWGFQARVEVEDGRYDE